MASVAYRGMVRAIRRHEQTKERLQNCADAFQSRGRFEDGEYSTIMNLIDSEYAETEGETDGQKG